MAQTDVLLLLSGVETVSALPEVEDWDAGAVSGGAGSGYRRFCSLTPESGGDFNFCLTQTGDRGTANNQCIPAHTERR